MPQLSDLPPSPSLRPQLSDDNLLHLYEDITRAETDPLRNRDRRTQRRSHLVRQPTPPTTEAGAAASPEVRVPNADEIERLRKLSSLQRTLKVRMRRVLVRHVHSHVMYSFVVYSYVVYSYVVYSCVVYSYVMYSYVVYSYVVYSYVMHSCAVY